MTYLLREPQENSAGNLDFDLLVDGCVIPCTVSHEALENAFGCDHGASAMRSCYVNNRASVEGAAVTLFLSAVAAGHGFSDHSRLLITTGMGPRRRAT